jgi:hypothetical protein
VEQQEQVALVYLTAFVLESCHPGSAYLGLFKDYRTGRDWLPGLVYLNQFHESTATILCEFEEDLDLTTGSCGVDSIAACGLALWKEGRIPKKWGDHRNNGVFLGWNNEEDSIPARYTIVLDSSQRSKLEGSLAFSFLAADAQVDPGKRGEDPEKDAESNAENDPENHAGKDDKGDRDDKGNRDEGGDSEEAEDEEDEEVPVDFCLVFTDTSGLEYRVRLTDFQYLQPAMKPQVFKSKLFTEDAESEVVQQYVSIPFERVRNSSGSPLSAGALTSITFIFDAEKKGTVLLDQIGFAR